MQAILHHRAELLPLAIAVVVVRLVKISSAGDGLDDATIQAVVFSFACGAERAGVGLPHFGGFDQAVPRVVGVLVRAVESGLSRGQ